LALLAFGADIIYSLVVVVVVKRKGPPKGANVFKQLDRQ
jgi:hypothetical protein